MRISSRKVSCESCPNLDCSLLRNCDPFWIRFISDHKTIFNFRKGQSVFYEHSPVTGMFFVLSGFLKVYKNGLNNKQQIVRFSAPGDIAGHRGFNRKFYPVSAAALTDAELCFITMEDFNELVRANSVLAYNLLFHMADELYNSEVRERNLAQLSVRERMADALVRIYKALGNENSTFLGVELSRQEIADFAGTTKEQVSRHLSDFKDENLVQLEGKNIFLCDLNKLRALSGTVAD